MLRPEFVSCHFDYFAPLHLAVSTGLDRETPRICWGRSHSDDHLAFWTSPDGSLALFVYNAQGGLDYFVAPLPSSPAKRPKATAV